MSSFVLHKYTSTVAEGAGSGAPGGLVGPTEWNDQHQLYLDANAQTGASYTIAAADDGAFVTFNNASAVAVALPQAQAGQAASGSALGFYKGWFCFARNLGAGDVTVTPTTSTINGTSKLVLKQYEQAIIVSDGTNYQALPIRWDITQTDGCYRGKIVAAVAANALSLAVKTIAGDDPSAADPVLFFMRDTAANLPGNILVRIATAALSVTVPSGATLGHVSARDQQIFVYALDNAGTIELGISNKFFDPSVRKQSSTTIGAGSIDPATIYSTTGRSNVAWKPLARCVSNQTTAGTWAAAPTQIDLAPFALPINACRVYLNSAQTGVSASTHTKCNFDTVDYDPDGIAVSSNSRLQPKVAGTYRVFAKVYMTAGTFAYALVQITRNGTAVDKSFSRPASDIDANCMTSGQIAMNGTSDYLEATGFANGAATFNAGNGLTTLECARVGP